MKKLLEILHQVSDRLLEVVEEREVFLIISDAITKLLPGVYFIVSKLQPDDMNYRIVESSGFDKYFNTIKTIIRKDPYTIDFPFEAMTDRQLEAFENGKIHHYQGGIHDLANGQINKTACKAIEKMLGIADVCALRFCDENKYYGGIALFIPNSTVKSGIFNQEVKLAIETISFQASAVIQKLRENIALREKKEELDISQKQFSQLINKLNDIVWKANADGSEIVDFSNSFEKIYGYSVDKFNENHNL